MKDREFISRFKEFEEDDTDGLFMDNSLSNWSILFVCRVSDETVSMLEDIGEILEKISGFYSVNMLLILVDEDPVVLDDPRFISSFI